MKKEVKYYAFIVFYILSFYAVVLYTRPLYIEFIIEYFSKIKFNDDLSFRSGAINSFMLLIYIAVSFFWNKKTLSSIGVNNGLYWTINWMIDYLFIPFSVLVMVLYYNNGKATIANLSSIENMFLVWVFMAMKHVVILTTRGKLVFGRKK